MHYTIFDTPVIRTLMRWISLFVFRMRGWRIEGRFPPIAKYVLIAAPHTSNWDFPITLCLTFALKGKIYWMGKDSLFRWPFRGMFKWLGGIPVDRSKSNNMVAQMIQRFSADENLVVTIPPAGTRSNVMKWKTGFYYIALGANVPVVLGFLNYRTKVGGIGPVYQPSGDYPCGHAADQIFLLRDSRKASGAGNLCDAAFSPVNDGRGTVVASRNGYNRVTRRARNSLKEASADR